MGFLLTFQMKNIFSGKTPSLIGYCTMPYLIITFSYFVFLFVVRVKSAATSQLATLWGFQGSRCSEQ